MTEISAPQEPCCLETELGKERRCHVCGMYWPADTDFFYRTTRRADGLTTSCRACLAEVQRNRRLGYVIKPRHVPELFQVVQWGPTHQQANQRQPVLNSP